MTFNPFTINATYKFSTPISLHFLLYNDVNAMRTVIGCCPWSIRVQIHGWHHGKLVFFVLFNMVRGLENVCEILSDKSKWKPHWHQWHTRLRLVCHFFVFTTFWGYLWSITEQTHGKMESVCLTELVERRLLSLLFLVIFSLDCVLILLRCYEKIDVGHS